MRIKLLALLSATVILFSACAYALPEPVLVSATPAGNPVYTTAPQAIPYTAAVEYGSIINDPEIGGNGTIGYSVWVGQAGSPQNFVSQNEATATFRQSNAPEGTFTISGNIFSKRLRTGNYSIVVQITWQKQGEEWNWLIEIPFRVSGPEPAPVPAPRFNPVVILPLGWQRFPAGAANQFPVEIEMAQTAPGKILKYPSISKKLTNAENPDMGISDIPAWLAYGMDWTTGKLTGTQNVSAGLPAGNYYRKIHYYWREMPVVPNELEIFLYDYEVAVPFAVYNPQDDHFKAFRALPDINAIPGVPILARIFLDPGSDTISGVVATEDLPAELEYVELENNPTQKPESAANPYVWLVKNAKGITFKEIRYGIKVREGTPAGTVITLSGKAEILGSTLDIGGDNTITVSGIAQECPMPNQVLLGHIDRWSRTNRGRLAMGEAELWDMGLLQIIEKWRNCIRGLPT